jgi:hypothetical protein
MVSMHTDFSENISMFNVTRLNFEDVIIAYENSKAEKLSDPALKIDKHAPLRTL